MRHRFARTARLLDGAEYRRVFNDGKRLGARGLGSVYRKNGLGYARLGLAISKRNVRRAVDRNRIKRQVREAFRLAIETLPSIDIVILARPEAAKLGRAEIRRSMEKLLSKIQCASSSS